MKKTALPQNSLQHFYSLTACNAETFVTCVTTTSQNNFVLHFAPRNIDDIIQRIWALNPKVETFSETFLGQSLIKKRLWLKQRIKCIKEQFSLKSFSLDGTGEFVKCTEENDETKIQKRLKKPLKKFKPFMTIFVTRCSVESSEGNMKFYIDSCRTEEQQNLGINDYYICCGCKASDPNSLFQFLSKLGIERTTMIYPAPSKIMECLYENRPELLKQEELDAISDVEEFRVRFHRRFDPLDREVSLYPDSQDLQNWCKRLGLPEKIAQSTTAKDLHQMTPQDVIQFAKSLGCSLNEGIALYFYLHLWQSPIRHEDDNLIETAKENLDNISHFTRHELERLRVYHDSQLDPEFIEECKEQIAFWVIMENRFVEWQIENKRPIVFAV